MAPRMRPDPSSRAYRQCERKQAATMNRTRDVEGLLALSQQEELVDLPKNYAWSSSEDEGGSDGERKHQKLLEAISSLDGKTRWKWAERSEASLMVSEFNVSSQGPGEKLHLSDLLGSAKTLSSLATVKKQLSRVKKKTLEIPLNKEEAEQILREVTRSRTSQMLSRWEPIVVKNRQAEQLVFPMEKEAPAIAPIEQVSSGWKARSTLEQEVFKFLHENKQPLTDPLLTPVEKASLKAMSLEEAKIHRAELQRARALQSYYEARARREKKIKSKKYHKIIKKGKAKKALKEFEQLWKVCPRDALQELGKMEKTRMMERMSLKHQGCGKWAKSKAVMAKYDQDARQAVQEQLAKNKELTKKFTVVSESEEEEECTEEGEPSVPVAVKNMQVNAEVLNPWMLRSCNSDAKGNEIKTDCELLHEPETHEFSESEGNERPGTKERLLLKEFEDMRAFGERSELNHNAEESVGGQETKNSNSQEVLSESRVLFPKLNKGNSQSRKQKVSSVGTALQTQRADFVWEEEEEFLMLQRLEQVQTPEREMTERNPRVKPSASERKKKEQMIDLQNLLTTKSPSVKSLAVPAIEELEDEVERDHRQVIKEAFAGDDVITEFLKEKREAIQANKLKNLDLTLPGWGEWVGVGLKPSAKKRRCFVIKAPEVSPRKDKDLPNVIVSENRNIHAAAHQVRVLPYPFTHHQQFERTVQSPIGSTWNTQRAFQKLTLPKVITKLGHIIKPIKAENVGFCSSSRSDLSVLQSSQKRLSRRHQKQPKKSSAD